MRRPANLLLSSPGGIFFFTGSNSFCRLHHDLTEIPFGKITDLFIEFHIENGDILIFSAHIAAGEVKLSTKALIFIFSVIIVEDAGILSLPAVPSHILHLSLQGEIVEHITAKPLHNLFICFLIRHMVNRAGKLLYRLRNFIIFQLRLPCLDGFPG